MHGKSVRRFLRRTVNEGVCHLAVCQNLVPQVNIKIAGKWMFIPLKIVLIGIDPYPYPAKNILFVRYQPKFRHHFELADVLILFSPSTTHHGVSPADFQALVGVAL